MPEPAQTKVCPLCAETIKAKAKVCPYCRKAQGRWFFVSRYDLSAGLALVAFLALGIFAFWIFGESRPYYPDRYKIEVLRAQFGVETNSESTNAVVFGVLTNESNYPWILTGFEIRFLDAAGNTADVAKAGSEYMNLTVLSHSECSFHLDLSRRSVPEHVSSKVFVTEAKEPGFWFNSD